MEASTAVKYINFPEKAQALLNSVYDLEEVRDGTPEDKIAALKKHYNLDNIFVASSEGIHNQEELLRALEFFVLQKLGALKEENGGEDYDE